MKRATVLSLAGFFNSENSMKIYRKILSAFMLILLIAVSADAIDISGPQSGVLTAGEYVVVGDISVGEGGLTIEPGAVFLFDGMYRFTILGESILHCQGTETDSIKFMPNYDNGNSWWDGIEFSSSGSDDLMEYCLITGSHSSGIACDDWYSSPTISNCTITDNYSTYGGGIFLRHYSDPHINNCTISGNTASWSGGGIYCENSNPTISNCIIEENQAEGNDPGGGGGIYIAGPGQITIMNCAISRNWSQWHGGGIYFRQIIPTISNCTIYGNTTMFGDGSGIFCDPYVSSFTIKNSAVTHNSGVGIYDGGNLAITYSDFYGNGGLNFQGGDYDPDLGVIVQTNTNGDPCDIFYNIFLDPIYVDPDNGDYHLQAGSPCIDAGDPNSPFDPDNTVADIGAFYFDQIAVLSPNGGETWRIGTEHNIEWTSPSEQDLRIELLLGQTVERVIAEGLENDGVFEWMIPTDITPGENYRIRCSTADGSEQDMSDGYFAITALPTLSLTPYLPPIVIPDFGGGFWYWTNISNPSPVSGTGQYWKEVVLPSGYTYGPLSVTTMTLGPWEVFAPEDPFPQWVPPYAPAGTYEFVMHVGIFPSLILATDSFEFVKLEGAGTDYLPESDWSFADWNDNAWASEKPSDNTQSLLPAEFTVSSAYPNPFNPSTTIVVSLPETAHLDVSVYNVVGQKVATLADGPLLAGEHHLTFHGSNMATGIYFIYTSLSGKLEHMQKVMLVK